MKDLITSAEQLEKFLEAIASTSIVQAREEFNNLQENSLVQIREQEEAEEETEDLEAEFEEEPEAEEGEETEEVEAEEEVEDEDFPYEDYEPSDLEMMSSFGTKWHDGL